MTLNSSSSHQNFSSKTNRQEAKAESATEKKNDLNTFCSTNLSLSFSGMTSFLGS